MKLLRNRVTDAGLLKCWRGYLGSRWPECWKVERDKLLRMEQELHSRVIGQDEAVSAVSMRFAAAVRGCPISNRPIRFVLFLGPTGGGKPSSARHRLRSCSTATTLMVRIGMSEFWEKHSVSRLVGAPPGYLGYEEGGYPEPYVARALFGDSAG